MNPARAPTSSRARRASDSRASSAGSASRPRSRSSAAASERWTSSAVNGFIRQPSARSGIGKRGALPLTNRHGTPRSLSRTATEKPVRPAGEMEVEQHEVGLILLRRGDRAVGILGHRDDAIARIVLDQIFERDCQLAVVLDNEDIEHPRPLPDAPEILPENP